MKDAAMKAFLQRFQAILDTMDEFEADEELEELNAQFEDALFLIESIDETDEDAAEELADAFDDLDDIAADYLDYAEENPEILEKANELKMALEMARGNLNIG